MREFEAVGPAPFVPKDGSKIRSWLNAAMPQPGSDSKTATKTSGVTGWVLSAGRAAALRAVTVGWSSPSIVSRAFTARSTMAGSTMAVPFRALTVLR